MFRPNLPFKKFFGFQTRSQLQTQPFFCPVKMLLLTLIMLAPIVAGQPSAAIQRALDASTFPPWCWAVMAVGGAAVLVAMVLAIAGLVRLSRGGGLSRGSMSYSLLGDQVKPQLDRTSKILFALALVLGILGIVALCVPPAIVSSTTAVVGPARLVRGSTVSLSGSHVSEIVVDRFSPSATASDAIRLSVAHPSGDSKFVMDIVENGIRKTVDVVPSDALPVGRALAGEAVVTHDGRLALGSFSLLPQTRAGSSGPTTMGVFIVSFSGSKPCGTSSATADCATDCSLANARSIMTTGTLNVRKYFSEVTAGAIDLSISDSSFVTVSVPGPIVRKEDIRGLVEAASPAGKKPSSFQKAVFLMPSNWRRDASFAEPTAGYAERPGDDIWVLGCTSISSFQVITHEIGHSFSLHHSGASYNGVFADYYDLSSIMSLAYSFNNQGVSRRGLNAINLDMVNAMPSSQVVELTQASQTVTLTSLSSRTASSPSTQLFAAKATVGSFTYWVELRTKVNNDADLNTALNGVAPSGNLYDRLLVHIRASTDGKTQIVASIAQGASWTDSAGKFSIKHDAAVLGKFVSTISGGSPSSASTSAPASSSPPSKKKCFGASSTTLVEGIGPLKLDELHIGHRVQCFDPHTGRVSFSPVISIVHDHEEDLVPVLSIELLRPDGSISHLTVTDTHLLVVPTDQEFRQSALLAIGDLVVLVDGSFAAVKRISKTKSRVRNPLTLSGLIVVDGVAASVHSVDHDRFQRLTAPLRMMYQISPSLLESSFVKGAVYYFDKYVTPHLE